MRLTGSAPSTPAAGGGATVSLAAGSVVAIQTTRQTGTGSNALETFATELSALLCYAAVITGTAAAGNKAIAELNNPAASGRRAYIYSVDIFVPVAMQIQIVLDGTTITPATAPINLTGGGGAAVVLVGGSNQLAPTGSLIYTTPTLTANVDYQIPQPWLCALSQAHNMQLIGQTVNQSFTCNVRWIEPSS